MNTIAIIFENISKEKSELLVALLQNTPMNGIEEQDNVLSIYYPEKQFHTSDIESICQQLQVTYITKKIESKNWNEEWEKSFEPICIDQRVAIRADFHPPFTHCEYELIITPKMSFGTGHHATTRLMITLMYDITLHNTSVLDFGCGTGVLSIFAEKKGAVHVDAIDNDLWSLENTKENIVKNNCKYITVSDMDITSIQNKYHIILANINLHILIQYADTLHALLLNNGIILLSGILISDENKILSLFTSKGFVCKEKIQENEWIALCMEKVN